MTTSYRKQQQIAKSNQKWANKEVKQPVPKFRKFKESRSSYQKIGMEELGNILYGK
jgi:hypothetical protein